MSVPTPGSGSDSSRNRPSQRWLQIAQCAVRYVVMDHAMQSPHPSWDIMTNPITHDRIRFVPVLRLFGSTPAGQKSCVFIHGYFPALSIIAPPEAISNHRSFAKTLKLAIERAVAIASNRNMAGTTLANSGNNNGTMRQVVHDIILYEGKLMYGYDTEERSFLRISLYDPHMLLRVADLLRAGAVLNTKFSVFEAHIGYYLQFSVDYNVLGMNYAYFSRIAFRALPAARNPFFVGKTAGIKQSTLTSPLSERIWLADAQKKVELSPLPKQTNCELEMDANCEWVLNKENILPDMQTQSTAFTDSKGLLVHSLAEIVADERDRWPPEVFAALIAPTPNYSRTVNEEEIFKYSRDTEERIREYFRLHPNDSESSKPLSHESTYSGGVSSQITGEDDLKWLQHFGEDSFEDASAVEDRFRDEEFEMNESVENEEQQIENDDQTQQDLIAISVLSQVQNINLAGEQGKEEEEKDLEPQQKKRREEEEEHHQQEQHEEKAKEEEEEEEERWEPLTNDELLSDDERQNVRSVVPNPPIVEMTSVGSANDSVIVISSDTGTPLKSNNSVVTHPVPLDLDGPVIHLPFMVPGSDCRKRLLVYEEPFPFPSIEENEVTKTSLTQTQISQISWSRVTLAKRKKKVGMLLEATLERLHGASDTNNQHLTTVVTEVHVCTRKGFVPDAEKDAIQAICLCIRDDDAMATMKKSYHETYYVFATVDSDNEGHHKWRELESFAVVLFFPTELDMIKSYTAHVRLLDPDVMVGFTMKNASYSYVCCRAEYLGFDAASELSRVVPSQQLPTPKTVANQPAPPQQTANAIGAQQQTHPVNHWFMRNNSGRITGRITITVWELSRHSNAATFYSLQNLAYEMLGWRLPKLSWGKRTKLWKNGDEPVVISYLLQECQATLLLLDAMNTIPQTSENARTFGIDFQSCINRGSQLRVESVMLRITRPRHFVLLSCSRSDVAGQRALECSCLTLEPPSAFNRDPVVVLDFQSLYPSIIIAYNLCYSTCLGRIPWHSIDRENGLPVTYKFGCSNYTLTRERLKSLRDKLFVSRNQIAFVRKDVRQGILPRMVEEILRTRILVKNALKREIRSANPDHGRIQMEDARQFSLKMVCNFVYGYTSASYSGRMPCVDIGDTIVECGRATVERAIRMVETEQWDDHLEQPRVIYGNTDSLFVILPGRTLKEAFALGQKMAERVTRSNPEPVVLQFEKVYQPSILLAKSRYVGFKYESPDSIPHLVSEEGFGVHMDKDPELEAKGIETIRRDSCPLVRKILDRTLRLFFEQSLWCSIADTEFDMENLQKKYLMYLTSQVRKLEVGQKNIGDFVFAKEVRFGRYSNPSYLPPAARIALNKMTKDKNAEPEYAERVQYVVVAGSSTARGGTVARTATLTTVTIGGGVAPDERLKDLIVTPQRAVRDPRLMINTEYYIVKQIIPALQRLLTPSVHLDIAGWYRNYCLHFGKFLPAFQLLAVNGNISSGEMSQEGGAAAVHRASQGRDYLFVAPRHSSDFRSSDSFRTIDSFFRRGNCFNCGDAVVPAVTTGRSNDDKRKNSLLCIHCERNRAAATAQALIKRNELEHKYFNLIHECIRCCESITTQHTTQQICDIESLCSSTECPTWYKRVKLSRLISSLKKPLS